MPLKRQREYSHRKQKKKKPTFITLSMEEKSHETQKELSNISLWRTRGLIRPHHFSSPSSFENFLKARLRKRRGTERKGPPRTCLSPITFPPILTDKGGTNPSGQCFIYPPHDALRSILWAADSQDKNHREIGRIHDGGSSGENWRGPLF